MKGTVATKRDSIHKAGARAVVEAGAQACGEAGAQAGVEAGARAVVEAGAQAVVEARRAVHASQARCRVVLAVLVAAFATTFVLSFAVGRFAIAPGDLMGFLLSKVLPTGQAWPDDYDVVVFAIRMPRVLAAVLVGACLSAAGLAFQSLFKNPLASPDIMGASSGAAFGAALAIFLHLGSMVVDASAFCFGLLAVVLAYAISSRMRHNLLLGIVLAGIMVGSLFSASTSLLKLVADVDETLPAITYWLMGSVSSVKMSDLAGVAAPMLAGVAGLYALRWRLNVIGLGDDEARSLGVNVRLVRAAAIACATLVTASSVAVSGVIGWVGLVVPHFGRLLVGEDQRYLMPATLLMGATFLLLVDNLARSLTSVDVPLGILTAYVGAPVFIYLIMRRRGSRR